VKSIEAIFAASVLCQLLENHETIALILRIGVLTLLLNQSLIVWLALPLV
jgi:hypothetical protein